jgi:curved DNA-binding protein CbpA
MDRRHALTLLGLDGAVDAVLLKQRYRALARDLHPDRGGDPVAFVDLTAAYELLRDELDDERPAQRPAVARGRPSRSADPSDGAASLDRVQLGPDAQALAARVTAAGACRYVSRAPGSPFNRLAGSLALGAPSSLTVVVRDRPARDAPGTTSVELVGRGRAARRALAQLDLAAVGAVRWSRQRGDAVTVLGADLGHVVAHRAAAAVTGLLDALDWPLREWSPES